MLDFDVLIVNVLQDCPDDSGDFRAAQCSEYDSTPLGGKEDIIDRIIHQKWFAS
jgi:hypothetical protein